VWGGTLTVWVNPQREGAMLGLGSGADSIPLLLPGLILSVVIALLAGGRVGRALGVGPVAGWLLIVSIGLVVVATLTPQAAALEIGHAGSGTCNLARFSFASLEEYGSGHEATGNVLLFVPLGVAIGWLPRSRPKAVLLALAIALPFVVETTQMLLPVLDRACESADVVDNLLGLATGLVLGAAAGLVVRRGLRSRSGPVAGDRS